jgi:hypothetical protein
VQEVPSNREDDPRSRIYVVDHVNPGLTFTRRFEIINTAGTPQHVAVYAAAATIDNDAFAVAAGRESNELSSWITIDHPEVSVAPHGHELVEATFRVPRDASKAERYAVVWAEVASAAPGADGNVQLVNRVGVRVYLDVGPGGDPPSDFQIDNFIPGRTKDGQPTVNATVTNTGQRALDLSGELWLSDGPSGLNAGPFPARLGTTLPPGGTAPVNVVLDDHVPNGPWLVKVTLRSGRVERDAQATITFPEARGAWGLPVTWNTRLSTAVITASAIALIVVATAVLVTLRRRWRPTRRVP